MTRLGRREREVLALVAEGLTNQEIARRMGISEQTAKSHMTHILAKLGIHSRVTAAVMFARGEIA